MFSPRFLLHLPLRCHRRLLCTDMGSNSLVISHLKDGVQTIELNSPKTRNALSLDMMAQLRVHLHSHLASHEKHNLLRCIVLRSAKSGAVFSSGHNLKELTSEFGREHHESIFKECANLMLDVVRLPVPVVVAVDGLAAAAGCQLVAMCDIAVATEKSTFSTPGSTFGLFCSTPGVPLARTVPRKVSAYMLLTGRPITGQEALRSGLVSRLVADSEALEIEVRDICDAIKSKPRAVVELGKKFFYRQLEIGLSQALDEGSRVMVENLTYRDAQEGLAAFKEKRQPGWTHGDDKAYEIK